MIRGSAIGRNFAFLRCYAAAQSVVALPSSDEEGACQRHAGENYVSFEISNQWISKREFELSPNRIEMQKLCPLNLWGHSFVICCAAAAGSRHCRQHGSSWVQAEPANTESMSLKSMGSWIRRSKHGSCWDQTHSVWHGSCWVRAQPALGGRGR